MLEPNWISAANVHCSEPILSKNRSEFDRETSSRSPHFWGRKNDSPKRYPIALRDTLGQPARRSPAGPLCSPLVLHSDNHADQVAAVYPTIATRATMDTIER